MPNDKPPGCGLAGMHSVLLDTANLIAPSCSEETRHAEASPPYWGELLWGAALLWPLGYLIPHRSVADTWTLQWFVHCRTLNAHAAERAAKHWPVDLAISANGPAL